MKVFGIGLSKTGTTSLATALGQLGLEVLHGGRRFVFEPPENLAALDGATDELALAYPLLDEKFPQSKFILTVREKSAWLASCQHHFRRPIDPEHWVGQMLFQLYGTNVFNDEAFSAGYERHLAGVRQYFAARPQDLLLMDIASGEGFEKLCPFLGRPAPSREFPRENVSRSWGRVWRRLRRLALRKPGE